MRTNLTIDRKLLDEALATLGLKTYSAVVELALVEILKKKKTEKILKFQGSGIWEGNLEQMRKTRFDNENS